MDEETRRIHRLLSDGKLSGPEIEEILENLNAAGRRREAARKKVRGLPYWAGSALAAAAAVLLFFVLPGEPGTDVRIQEEGDLGGLEVRCEPGTLDACPVSGKIVFAVSGKRVSGFLSAYAEPVGHDAGRVFYYSKEDGSVKVPSASAVRPLGLSKPGRYRVHAVIAVARSRAMSYSSSLRNERLAQRLERSCRWRSWSGTERTARGCCAVRRARSSVG